MAHSSLPFGPNKVGICHRDKFPCGCGAPETVLHTFHECPRSRRVWESTLKQWRSITGEHKVKATNAAITLLGDRSWSCSDGVRVVVAGLTRAHTATCDGAWPNSAVGTDRCSKRFIHHCTCTHARTRRARHNIHRHNSRLWFTYYVNGEARLAADYV